MITTKELRSWPVLELQAQREKRVAMIKRMCGSLYPNIVGGEIGQIDKELMRREPKIIYVSWDEETDADYRFELETARGRRRVLPRGCHPGETVCQSSEQIRLWLKGLKVTHVVSKFDCKKTDEATIKDGKYTVAQYIKWWKRAEEDE